MPKRRGLSKKTRFEVFKRDGFTCQYCGAKAPDAILHVDHIEPVSKGGDNSILNLITACDGCNSGKSDRRLSDQTTLAKQVEQLAELSQRQEQLRLMVEWRKGLKSLGDQELEAACDLFQGLTGWGLNDSGRNDLRGLLRVHGISRVLDSIPVAVERHVNYEDGVATNTSVGIAFRHIESICKFKSVPQEVQDQRYIFGILRNRVDLSDRSVASEVVESIKGATTLLGIAPVREFAKSVHEIEEWWNFVSDAEYEHATAGGRRSA